MASHPEIENLIVSPIIILMPVYNDWTALRSLIQGIDAVLSKRKLQADVLLVDDGSTKPNEDAYWHQQEFGAIQVIETLQLARNLGHQRAIAVGLAYIQVTKACKAVVIMDADGEDSPADIVRLIDVFEEQGGDTIIFAQRGKRSESWAFKSFYGIYRGTYRLLTGSNVRFGNFSIIPGLLLPKLVVVSEIWNHYAAGVMKSKLPYAATPTIRSPRLAGRSQMSFVSLVIHGLGAISVHADVIGVRALIATLLLAVISVVGVSAVVLIRTFTSLSIPGWASFVTLLFLILLTQAVMMAALFVFVILNSRSTLGFIPCRDYEHFVLSVKRLYPQR